MFFYFSGGIFAAELAFDKFSGSYKTEYMCFNQRGVTSSLIGGTLKLVDKFTCREIYQYASSKDSYG